jgi:radical SAM protein with 4Fe4S-binding SPASM domain
VAAIRFCGGEDYEPLERLQQACAAAGIRAEVVLARRTARDNEGAAGKQDGNLQIARIGRSRLEALVAAGANSFLLDLENEADGPALWVLKTLRELGFANVRASWYMHKGNAEKLKAVAKAAEEAGAEELIVTGMRPSGGKNTGTVFPDREQLAAAGEYIGKHIIEYNERKEKSEQQAAGMLIEAETCFSPLRAYIEGKDPKRNGNRGIERGCEAGSSFMAVRADGRFTPCLHLPRGKDNAEGNNVALPGLADYWEQSPELQALRKSGEARQCCTGCCYERRCLPCPACADGACRDT